MVHLQLPPLNFIYENLAVQNKQTYNKALNRETPLINYIELNNLISIGAHLENWRISVIKYCMQNVKFQMMEQNIKGQVKLLIISPSNKLCINKLLVFFFF